MSTSLAMSTIVAVSAFDESITWSPFQLMQNPVIVPNFLTITPDTDMLSASFDFSPATESIFNLVGNMVGDVLNVVCNFKDCPAQVKDAVEVVGDFIKGLKNTNALLAFQADGEVKLESPDGFGLKVDGAAFAISNIGGFEHVAVSADGDADMKISFSGIGADADGDVKFNANIYQQLHFSSGNSTTNSTRLLATDATWSAAQKLPEGVKTVATMSNDMTVTFMAYSNGTLAVSGSNIPEQNMKVEICYRSFVAECNGNADWKPSKRNLEEAKENAHNLFRSLSEESAVKKPFLTRALAASLNGGQCTAPKESRLQCNPLTIIDAPQFSEPSYITM